MSKWLFGGIFGVEFLRFLYNQIQLSRVGMDGDKQECDKVTWTASCKLKLVISHTRQVSVPTSQTLVKCQSHSTHSQVIATIMHVAKGDFWHFGAFWHVI